MISIYLQISTNIICIYQEINWFYCMTLGNEMSPFAENKKVPGSQHLFSLCDSTMPCGSWYPRSQITATKQMINTKWLRLSHHYSKIGLRAKVKYDFSILINPNFCCGNSYFHTKEVWNTMGEMSPRVHGKDLSTLVWLISIKSVLKTFANFKTRWK